MGETVERPTPQRVAVERIFDLRHRVLRTGLPAEASRYERDHDADCAHFAIIDGDADNGIVIGCVSVHPEPLDGEPAWRLRGMAVDPAAHGGGLGRRLVQAVEKHVIESAGADLIWCNARVPAIGFYERCGWTATGPVYDIPTAGPHRKMHRRLDRAAI